MNQELNIIESKLKTTNCPQCNVTFQKTKNQIFCTPKCSNNSRNDKRLENQDHFECPVCHQKMRQLSMKHAKMHGYKNAKEMQLALNMPMITCEALKAALRGENNHAYQHGGKYSKFSKKFIHGYDAEWHKNHNKNISKLRNENKELFKSNIEYWNVKYPDDAELAMTEYKKSQIRDLNHFIEKYGEEEGKIRHQSKTEKWIKSTAKHNFSKISQELFSSIMSQCTELDPVNIYYATYDRHDMKKYINKEFRLKTNTSFVMPDFIDLAKKKVIEFDGDYWHSAENVNSRNELLRDEKIKQAGYEIMHVKECDYRDDKQQMVNECINFLTK